MPNALVTNLGLGAGINGLALTAEVRRRWPQLYAVLISGGAGLRLHSGDQLLGKPFSMGFR